MSSEAQKDNNDAKKKASRRAFLAGTGGLVVGAAVGVAAGSLGFPKTVTKTQTETSTSTSTLPPVTSTETSTTGATAIPTTWDLTADVVVIGGGAAGMCAALAAKQSGASVIIVEMNYDLGGHSICSGGQVDLGAGTVAQAKWGIKDSPQLVWSDLVVPSTSYNPTTGAPVYGSNAGPFQDRSQSWAFAQNNVLAFNFLVNNGITFQDLVTPIPINNGHWNGVSHTDRTNLPLWPSLNAIGASKTGVGPASALIPAGGQLASSAAAGPDSPVGNGGVGFSRPLQITARAIGVQILNNYQAAVIYRDAPYSGTVRGVQATYTGGRIPPGSTTPLLPWDSGTTFQGNQKTAQTPSGFITMTQATVNIKANKGVVVCTGGASSNVLRRMRANPQMTAVYQVAAGAYSQQTGDGSYMAMKIGAAQYALGNELSNGAQGSSAANITKTGYIGCREGYVNLHYTPNSPVFGFVGQAGGLHMSATSTLQDMIHVNQVGQRFVDETVGGFAWVNACLSTNSGSQAPDWAAGPVWAIFDSAAVTREQTAGTTGWASFGPPNTDPNFFYQANDIPTLVTAINTNKYQTVPMQASVLQAAIARYNGFVAAKLDSDFGKPMTSTTASNTPYPISAPPYYAAFCPPTKHDFLFGIQINNSGQALDLDGNVIPGLFAAGEEAGGMIMHGLEKCVFHGILAGQAAATGTFSDMIAPALGPTPAGFDTVTTTATVVSGTSTTVTETAVVSTSTTDQPPYTGNP